jgi:hypothetical protein
MCDAYPNLHAFNFPHSFCMIRPIHDSNYTWPRVQFSKVFVRQFSPPSRLFVLLWSQIPGLRVPHQKHTPIQMHRQHYILLYSNF